jgi:phosphoglycerol transferase MdoB-like AlkP superfamily enzyme
MKNYLIFLCKQMLFWFAVFAFSRIVFFLYYAPTLALQDVTFWDVFPTLAHAWKLDLSSACYLLLVPLLLTAAQMGFKKNFVHGVIFGYTTLMLLVYFTTMGGELGTYGEWLCKLNYRALFFLRHPDEVVNSVNTATFVLLVVLVLASVVLWAWVYKRWLLCKLPRIKWFYIPPYVVLGIGLLFLGLRGGPKQIPIHQSVAYFSQKQILNDIAVNSAWNLLHSVLHGAGILEKNPFVVMPHEEAEKIVQQLHHVPVDTTTEILSVAKPNVVLLILESWSGDLIESIAGTAGITPCFKKLQGDGLFFAEMYAGGKRSQQGLAGIFAGYPALPQVTLCDFPEKSRQVPTITHAFNRNGYRTSFYFGGQTEYGNIGVFLLANNFARLMVGADFKGNVHRGKLGVHDEDVLAKQLVDLATEPQPFFSALFTVSSHSPYDQPLQGALDLDLPEMPFLNSVFYTDKCLGEYCEKARQQPWYPNTLFILVADHGRVTHIARDYYSFEHVHVPMLFYGDVLKPEFRGQSISHLATQADIPATLLKQLNMDTSPFPWSKNILNPHTQNFVYVEEATGPGYKRPEGNFVYSFDSHSFIHHNLPPADSARVFREGMAYLQVLFGEFIEL